MGGEKNTLIFAKEYSGVFRLSSIESFCNKSRDLTVLYLGLKPNLEWDLDIMLVNSSGHETIGGGLARHIID